MDKAKRRPLIQTKLFNLRVTSEWLAKVDALRIVARLAPRGLPYRSTLVKGYVEREFENSLEAQAVFIEWKTRRS